jgi:hypothetical protein
MITNHHDEVSNSYIPSNVNLQDPADIHEYLSKVPYGEEEESFLAAITTELALQIPWTSQLRLCSRTPYLQKQLLPHIWNKVQYFQDDDIIDHDSWMSDSLILCWRMNRFHIQNEITPLPRMLRMIMERIDSILGIKEPLLEDGISLLPTIGNPPSIVLEKYQVQSRDSRPSLHPKIHAEFLSWIAQHRYDTKLQESFQILCNYIGKDRSVLSHLEAIFDKLPIELMTFHFSKFEGNRDNEVTQIGFALLIAFFKRQGVNVKTDPLPPDLILGKSDGLPTIIQAYLYQGVPNVNNLVLFLWTEQYSDLLNQFSNWLPLEPIIPLICRALQTRIDWEVSIDMLFTLDWQFQHLKDVFAHMLGDSLPRNAIKMKEAVRSAFYSCNDIHYSESSEKRTSLENIQRTRGLKHVPLPNSHIQKNLADHDSDDADTDYSFDDTDDRVLLL